MRRHVPKIKKGNLRSNVGKMFSSSKKLPKAQAGTEMIIDVTGYNYPVLNTKKTQTFNPMFYGDGPGTTNYVNQVFETGPDYYGQGLGGLYTKTGSGYTGFPGAPHPSNYGGNQRKYIRALNRFRKDMLKSYRDLYTDGATPTQTSTSRLREIPGTQEYLDAANKLDSYINSEIEMINQANVNAGTGKRNKRTKGNKRNKNRLFR